MGSLGISVLERKLCTSSLTPRGHTGSDSLESWHIASISKRIRRLEITHDWIFTYLTSLPKRSAVWKDCLGARAFLLSALPLPDSISILGENPWRGQSLSKWLGSEH